ncbi:CBS domain-containing protein [Arsenicicoccus piscis]|uniref:CBS domain-containing protein n=1 Tax=Arsenicicoccus piscis TaxID=673954 RepID=UPI001F4C72B7|nr:CBS domain-containing protein [Arsenicicoccus piscis]MCH8628954.1 CBS domain-containing protein [Arsenicicoccus piscis]
MEFTEPSALARNEVNAAYVLGDRARVLGIVTDGDLSSAIGAGVTDLRSIVSQDFRRVRPDDLVGSFMEHAGRHAVPITVVGNDGRLVGVVTRAEILSSLSDNQHVHQEPRPDTHGTEDTVTS